MQLKLPVFLSILIFCLNVSAQQTGHTTITFVDSSRNNRQIVTEVYYPATTAGTNAPLMNGVFPVITFGHGFVMTVSAYQNIWEQLVPEGYILAFPTTEGSISPSHAEFANDLKFLITKIRGSGVGKIIPASSVGSTSAIMGHSMGGGSAFLSSKNNTTITTMVSFAAANTNPSSIAASRQISVPVLIFSGSNDCVAPPSQHQNIMYDSTAAASKTQLYITGGGHCYFANNNFNCTFGEGTCSPSPAISRAQQQSATADFLKLWLAYYLKNDCQKAQDFQDSLSASKRITYRQSQTIACATAISNIQSSTVPFNIFPNPANNSIQLKVQSRLIGSVYTIFDKAGKAVLTGKIITENSVIELGTIPAGMYVFRAGESFKKSFLVIKE